MAGGDRIPELYRGEWHGIYLVAEAPYDFSIIIKILGAAC